MVTIDIFSDINIAKSRIKLFSEILAYRIFEYLGDPNQLGCSCYFSFISKCKVLYFFSWLLSVKCSVILAIEQFCNHKSQRSIETLTYCCWDEKYIEALRRRLGNILIVEHSHTL